jgi:uncharacterized protein YyaL (SSP411 family)
VIAIAVANGVTGLPPTMAHAESNSVNAWVCQGVNCLPPIGTTTELAGVLADGGTG